ncbi:MAG: hypothetical protein ACOVRN_07395 [Flavobacterium sp.]
MVKFENLATLFTSSLDKVKEVNELNPEQEYLYAGIDTEVLRTLWNNYEFTEYKESNPNLSNSEIEAIVKDAWAGLSDFHRIHQCKMLDFQPNMVSKRRLKFKGIVNKPSQGREIVLVRVEVLARFEVIEDKSCNPKPIGYNIDIDMNTLNDNPFIRLYHSPQQAIIASSNKQGNRLPFGVDQEVQSYLIDRELPQKPLPEKTGGARHRKKTRNHKTIIKSKRQKLTRHRTKNG